MIKWLVSALVLCTELSGACSLRLGYRQDSLSWNIAGPRDNPNVLSELTWSPLCILEVGAKTRLETDSNLFMVLDASYGRIVQGYAEDADYHASDRMQLFSYSKSRSNGDDVYDLSGCFGFSLDLQLESAGFKPLIGYSFSAQNVLMEDGMQLIATPPLSSADLGPIRGLHNFYQARWHGPWAGFEGFFVLDAFSFVFGYEWHYTQYKGQGKWNLRLDFVGKFEDTAVGFGQVGYVELGYFITPFWHASILCKYSDFVTNRGVQKTQVLAETVGLGGRFPVTVQGTFNKALWSSVRSLFQLAFFY